MQIRQGFTPLLVKRLIQITLGFTLITILLDPLLHTQQFFALTPDAIDKYYLWQFITSLFLIPTPVFSFGYLVDVAFSMLILWLMGSILYERVKTTKFIIGYALSGIVSGIFALFAMKITSQYLLVSEFFPSLVALVTMWTMADPKQQLYLLFVLPLKAQWILTFALLGTIATSALQQDYVGSAAYFSAFVFSYFYSLIALDFRSPFDWMLGIDRVIKKTSYWLHSVWQWHIMGLVRKCLNIPRRFFQGIRTRREAFVDRTLEKISTLGKESLSLYERFRLWWISVTK